MKPEKDVGRPDSENLYNDVVCEITANEIHENNMPENFCPYDT
jgi:hypothetical protein